MDLAVWQIILLVILAFCSILDSLSLNIGCQYPVIIGTLAGLIMGDVTLGLAVGATLQLMVLGVGTYGGASIPDFVTGAIVGTAFAVISNQDVEFAIGIAVPVGLLMVQLDVLARFTNTFFLHRIDKNILENNIPAIKRNVLLGALPWGLSRAIPVFIMLVFGENIVNLIVDGMPDWLMGGLKVAGGILPVVGIAILLRYLPTKKFVAYLILGFVAASYLKVPMLGVALIGLALAIIFFQRSFTKKLELAGNSNITMTGVENEDGEYED
ncbi:PTS sugar transporter subunit IIC [Caldifermentibacillus hisashii]|jgi:PTS system mannose-specific IIC component|uniref:PTS system, mannose-specific IIC component n=1 Tax=Caldibacillus thermoamylovorans TaxID=35841 RepID=A0ABD4AB56_9BACI|nr:MULTISPECIES: PTS sugar transporter subunit IIC [Bacillaceae]KIO60566.1 PTS system, mannose-specific IIC component [Caldibacillus thermoamylovorans]KIO74343.1 PTS system, mannose-specific IIC component [Caldibacillus thermoamylovorans]MED4853161.1 PTS sugar transporter subunit IIC [Caldifermentibacillus hisashii]